MAGSPTDGYSLSQEEIDFTNAFNNQRQLLAGFSKCATAEELGVVRDGLYLGLAHDLLGDHSISQEYEPVKRDIVMSLQVAESTRQPNGFATTIRAARVSEGWEALVKAVLKKAENVNCDLEGIWKTLENGRLEWLQAASGAHKIKMLLRNGLYNKETDTAAITATAGDISDAKMIWMYALCLNIPSLKQDAFAWAARVKMVDPETPLVGYQPEMWDARIESWSRIDLGAQAAAERGGSSIEEAWNAE
mmetsp:Transcript_7190/g.9330  ORF Transcript_7190/g.9330 Transcript_7190/m.9330 type:complete len:248 (+) Transcript_7190:54-797(+)